MKQLIIYSILFTCSLMGCKKDNFTETENGGIKSPPRILDTVAIKGMAIDTAFSEILKNMRLIKTSISRPHALYYFSNVGAQRVFERYHMIPDTLKFERTVPYWHIGDPIGWRRAKDSLNNYLNGLNYTLATLYYLVSNRPPEMADSAYNEIVQQYQSYQNRVREVNDRENDFTILLSDLRNFANRESLFPKKWQLIAIIDSVASYPYP